MEERDGGGDGEKGRRQKAAASARRPLNNDRIYDIAEASDEDSYRVEYSRVQTGPDRAVAGYSEPVVRGAGREPRTAKKMSNTATIDLEERIRKVSGVGVVRQGDR